MDHAAKRGAVGGTLGVIVDRRRDFFRIEVVAELLEQTLKLFR